VSPVNDFINIFPQARLEFPTTEIDHSLRIQPYAPSRDPPQIQPKDETIEQTASQSDKSQDASKFSAWVGAYDYSSDKKGESNEDCPTSPEEIVANSRR
jgi:hypothetical protein